MKTQIKTIALLVGAVSLSACSYYGSDGQSNYYKPYSFGQKQRTATAPLYPDGYDNTSTDMNDNYDSGVGGNGAYVPGSREVVTIPDSYHSGGGNSPASFRDRETSWVKRQNPQNFTIELDDSSKASEVASTLQKAPKDARRAEVKYSKGGEKHYRGVYGTYSSYESAQKALNKLPEDVRNKASVKTWGSVQSSVGN